MNGTRTLGRLLEAAGAFTGRLLAAGALLGAGVLLSSPTLAQDVPDGFVGPDPVQITFTLEGCRLGDDDGTYAPLGSLVCADGAYTTGNLGKLWNELDLVPHRMTADADGAPANDTLGGQPSQRYQINVGADNFDTPWYAYDYVSAPVLNTALSSNGGADCEVTLITQNDIGDFGFGGADEQIVNVLEINQRIGSTCVIDYVEQLAITSSNIAGSSTRSFVASGTGEKSVPIPSDILPQFLDKEMSAVENSLVKWTIAKAANPTTVNFGDTCDAATPLTQDVDVTITYNKLAAEPTALEVTSTVSVTNNSQRQVEYDCTDVLYGIAPGDTTESTIDTVNRDPFLAPSGMSSFDIDHEVAAGTRSLRNELACDLSVEEPFNPGNFTYVATLDASFSLPDNDIVPGTVVNDSVTIADTESISGAGFSFSTGAPTGATGSFDAGYAGEEVPTDFPNPVDWTSDPQNASGQIVFTKTVKVQPYYVTTSGTLSDTATLPLSNATDVEASASSTLYSDPRVSLTIQKTIPDILQGSDTIDCSFIVKNDEGQAVPASPVTLSFAAGDTVKSTTLTNLDPDNYIVTEDTCGGLTPTDPVSGIRNVDLTLAGATSYSACSATADFTNGIPTEALALAEVDKKTFPAGQEDGWIMELKRWPSNDGSYTGTPSVVSSLTTADSTPDLYETFPDNGGPFYLPEGDYQVIETLKPGWTNVTSTGCAFTVDYPASYGQTYSCQYVNEQKGTVIIEKQTIPDGEQDLFTFSQDVDGSGNFQLADDGTKTFLNVPPNDSTTPYYTVTELDPTPGYDLTNVVCTDDFTGEGYNIADSSANTSTGVSTIKVDPGETVKCVYTNTKRGMVEVLKLTNGVEGSTPWNFTLVGPDVNAADSVPPNPMDFGPAKLVAGEEYRLCEVGIPAGWTVTWYWRDGSGDTMIPFAAAVNDSPVGPDGYSNVFDPNYVAPPDTYTNDTRCVNFVVEPGETVRFVIDNSFPGGEPRTIGYWKNWNTCSGGGQADSAAEMGGAAAGYWLLDDVLQNPGITIGLLVLGPADCDDAVALLDKRDIGNGKKRANDAAYGLAAQLVAALANFTAGAETCDAAVNAVNDAQALLLSISFDGTGSFLRPKDAEYNDANYLAYLLDEYNNGFLCN